MPDNDYYKVLGVNKTAAAADIKKAYRKLAMKYHPDHTQGDKGAEEKFKNISEAYAVLSDKQKRQQYDTFGSAGFHQRFSQEDIFKGFDFSNIFKEFGFGGSNYSRGNRGGARFSFGGGSPFDGIFNQQQATPKGTDLVYELPLTLQEIATGTTKTVTFSHQGRSENLTVKIPKGMIAGKKLRLKGKGEPSSYGGSSGDLFIQSSSVQDSEYRVEGHDLYLERTVKLSDALLGTSISIPVLDGKQLSLKVPPGTQHKTKMRLSRHGLPHMRGKGKGNLYVLIHIDLPRKLTREQKKLVEKLAATGL